MASGDTGRLCHHGPGDCPLLEVVHERPDQHVADPDLVRPAALEVAECPGLGAVQPRSWSRSRSVRSETRMP
jgi:hypothetical protein